MSKTELKYLLAIKRGNNDYLPLEWHLTRYYNNEDLTSLEGIDKFTKRITRQELITEALALNMIDLDERYIDFSIIYPKGNKFNELKEGCIFKDDLNILDEDFILSYIVTNLDNKAILNKISNLCKGKTDDIKIIEFKYLLKNINLFVSEDKRKVIKALQIFKDISYENRRSIIIKLSKRVIVPEIKKNYS